MRPILFDSWVQRRPQMWQPQPAAQSTGKMAYSQLYFAAGGNEPRTVTTQRRRRSEPPAGGRERADAPTRDTRPPASSGGSRPPSGGGYSSGGGGGGAPLPPGYGGGGARPSNPLMLIALLVVLLLCIGPFMIFNGLGGGEDSQVAEQPAQVAAPVIATPRPVQQSQPTPVVNLTPARRIPRPPRLIMLYQDADDKILERTSSSTFNEAEPCRLQ